MTGNVFDRSVKALARRYPQPFVKMALGSIENISVETIENQEINLPEKRPDFVYGLRQEDREYILHLEFQLEHRTDMPERMFTYNALRAACALGCHLPGAAQLPGVTPGVRSGVPRPESPHLPLSGG